MKVQYRVWPGQQHRTKPVDSGSDLPIDVYDKIGYTLVRFGWGWGV